MLLLTRRAELRLHLFFDLLGKGLLVDPALTGSSRVLFTARAPIFLRLGNPSAVTLTINGKTVSLPAKVRSNGVIRIMSGGVVRT